MEKETKFMTTGGFIGRFIIHFIVYNFLVSLAFNVGISILSDSNQSLAGIINLVAIPLAALLTFYWSTCGVFKSRKLNKEDSKNAFIGATVVIIIFAILQFYSSYTNLANSLDSFYYSWYPGEIKDNSMLLGTIINAIQTIAILLIIPVQRKWINNRCNIETNNNSHSL